MARTTASKSLVIVQSSHRALSTNEYRRAPTHVNRVWFRFRRYARSTVFPRSIIELVPNVTRIADAAAGVGGRAISATSSWAHTACRRHHHGPILGRSQRSSAPSVASTVLAGAAIGTALTRIWDIF